MIQHKPILTDAEMHILISGNPFTLGLSIARLKDFIHQVEKAVVAKLAEQQEPAWWEIKEKFTGRRETTDCGVDAEFTKKRGGYDVTPLYPRPCVSPTSDKTACVSENGESETQTNAFDHLEYIKRYQKWRRRETEPHSMGEIGLNGKQIGESLDWLIGVAENHIPDINKTATDIYWINPDYPSYESVLDAFEPISSSVEIKVGDRYEVSSAKMLPTLTIEVTELDENGDVKAYRVLGNEHAPDVGNMITPLAQRKIQSLLDKGEYRVIENATVLVNENGHAAIVNHGGAFYWVENEALAREYDGTLIDEGTITTKLSLSVDTKEVQALLQSYLDGLDGWQLVPKEATDDMYLSFCHVRNDIEPDEFREAYRAILEASPKYTGDSNE